MPFQSILYDFNRARLWRRRVGVWGKVLKASSMDRLLFLWLHRTGWMGNEERDFFRGTITPGLRIADIGANIGLYTLLLSELTGPTGRVFAFEPEPKLFRALESNCRRNGLSNVTLCNRAVGAESGRLALSRNIFNSGDNRLTPTGAPTGSPLHVEVVRLDDALPALELDFAKIDTQGHEDHIFRGMDKVMNASPNLKMFFEFWPFGLHRAGTDPAAMLQRLASRGFRIHHPDKKGLCPVNDFQRFTNSLTGKKYTNLFATRSV